MDLRKQIRLKKQLFEVVIISSLQDLNHVRNIPLYVSLDVNQIRSILQNYHKTFLSSKKIVEKKLSYR